MVKLIYYIKGDGDMKKGAISISVLLIMCTILSGCSMTGAVNESSANNGSQMIEGKDYGQNLNPLDSLRKKFI